MPAIALGWSEEGVYMSDRLNLIDTIAKQDQFSTFSRLMRTSKANDIFNGPGDFTVFAPTNDAFAKMPDATMNGLTSEEGQKRLRELLSYHILPGKVMAASLPSAPVRKAFNGEELMFTDISGLKVNGASIQARNLEATNGVAHALETVLIPTRVPRPSLSTGKLTMPTAISPRPTAPATTPSSAVPHVTSARVGSPVPPSDPAATATDPTKNNSIL
jgi:uncharacterized surface protein with fasciclin (FAS1) repeats